MTKYREILWFKSMEFSERNIATSCGVSRNTVAKVTKRADELQLKWPLDFDMTDNVLDNKWYHQICGGESALVDVIMDRISYASYKIDIESTDPSKDISMGEVCGLDPAQVK